MTRSVLLTLGRLPKALELARALHAAGCRVIIAEPFAWHLCKPSNAVSACYRVTAPNTDRKAYLRELLEIIERENISLVVPVSEESLHVAALREQLPAGVRLLCGQQRQLAELHDKQAFAMLAERLGLPVPPTYGAGSPQAIALARAQATIAKPAHSCSGIGIECLAVGELPAASRQNLLVQAFVDGDHISSLSLLQDGRELARVLYRGTVFAGTVAICFERVDAQAAIDSWIDTFCTACPISGFVAFDFILDGDGVPWAIECNPRVTSGVHFLEPRALGAALLAPSGQAQPRLPYKSQRRFQWAYSTLTEAYRGLPSGNFRQRMGELFSAREVVWSLRDPLPFLLMTPMSWEILWPALTSRLTLGEATQRDIGWFGPPAGDD